ncbi:MAG: ribosome maturation factor RimM [Alphaproteobacteria bacterium]|jgi:16S rRNA processing protein RimM|nr:ribosome maturation factor RimM [Alphaproteobacteria bacterium]
MSNLLLIGRVLGGHGIKGEVRIHSFTDDPLALTGYRDLKTADGSPALTVLSARLQKGGVVARCKGIETRDQADALKGMTLHIDRGALPAPDEDEFYLADLVGLAAASPEGEAIGKVKSVQNFGAGDILEITPANGGATWYLPFTRDCVPEVLIGEGRIVVVMPDEIEVEGDLD